MKFLKINLSGSFNSFRYPDFHTYHKTLPLPTKTTICGMLGAALGISPEEINKSWLQSNHFQVGIIGRSNGKTNDLWQIRKYKQSQISNYQKGKVDKPYFTSVIMRELLFNNEYFLYINFNNENDLTLIENALKNPAWALSLGREDEIVKIKNVCAIELDKTEKVFFQNTVLPIDISQYNYKIKSDYLEKIEGNILSLRPFVVKLPLTFKYNDDFSRTSEIYQTYTFVLELPVQIEGISGWHDENEKIAFHLI